MDKLSRTPSPEVNIAAGENHWVQAVVSLVTNLYANELEIEA